MADESSDILGGGPIPLRPLHSTPWYRNPNKVGPILVLFFAGYILFRQASLRFQKWQEKSYKLATRRRYGIPDNDHRPFNVAYAAVNRERQARNTTSRSTLDVQQSYQPLTTGPNVDGQIRQRFNSLGPSSAIPSWAAPQTSGNQPGSPLRSSQLIPTEIRSQIAQPTQQHRTHRSGRRPLDLSRPANNDRRKRAFDDVDDPDSDHAKKSRVEGEELIDGDEDAEWQEDGVTDRNQRGSKRLYADEQLSGDDAEPSKRIRDKRARKVSREHTPEDQVMAGEEDPAEDDDVSELKPFSRGKKRDRVEAGSSFGGDDEDRVDDEGYESSKVSRSRKRRTVHNRKSEAHDRSSERDRITESYESGADGDRLKRRSKRTDRSVSNSSDDELISEDPLCKGRRIGEEWEMNGVQYKVGPNGDRLRQALIKKARSKFNMPKDSEHPDRAANMEVYVETWLTEEQYNDAKERQQLAWQGSGSASVEPDSSLSPPESPKKVGKDLLWTSTMPSEPVPRRRNAFRQSIATNVVRINPFENPLPSPSRRVASAYAGPPPDLLSISMSSPTGSSASSPRPIHRSFSKWEKQDLEAEAMRKMRSKAQEQKKAAEEKKKAEAATTLAPTPAPSSSLPPTITSAASFSIPKPIEEPTTSNPAKARADTPSLIVPVATKEPVHPAGSTPIPSLGSFATTLSPFTVTPSHTTAQPQPGGNIFAIGGSRKPSFASSPLAAPSVNTSTTPAAPSLAPKPFLGFGTSPSTPASTSSAPPPPATTFSFNNTAAAITPAGPQIPFGFPAQKKDEPVVQSSIPGTESKSLLARLGQAPATSTPSFFRNASLSFPAAANTGGEGAKMNAPSSAFGQTQATASTTPASTPVAAPLKFNFAVPATSAVAPTPSPPATVSAFGVPTKISEVAPSPFNAPATPIGTPGANLFATAKPAGATDKNPYSFGKLPATSNSTTPLPAANGGAFSFLSGAGNAFGSTAAAPPAKGFGNAGGLFGGVGSTTPTSATDSAAAFGARTPSGVPPALFPKVAESGITPFSFGATPVLGSGAATGKPTNSPMTFKFGSSASSSPFGVSATTGASPPSPFGAPAATNGGLFGLKGTAATTTPTSFGFGTGSGFPFGSAPPTPGAE